MIKFCKQKSGVPTCLRHFFQCHGTHVSSQVKSSIVYLCLTSVYIKIYLTYKTHIDIYDCHSKRIARDNKTCVCLVENKLICSRPIIKSKFMSKVNPDCQRNRTIPVCYFSNYQVLPKILY